MLRAAALPQILSGPFEINPMREQQLGGTALCSTLLLQQHQQMLISNADASSSGLLLRRESSRVCSLSLSGRSTVVEIFALAASVVRSPFGSPRGPNFADEAGATNVSVRAGVRAGDAQLSIAFAPNRLRIVRSTQPAWLAQCIFRTIRNRQGEPAPARLDSPADEDTKRALAPIEAPVISARRARAAASSCSGGNPAIKRCSS